MTETIKTESGILNKLEGHLLAVAAQLSISLRPDLAVKAALGDEASKEKLDYAKEVRDTAKSEGYNAAIAIPKPTDLVKPVQPEVKSEEAKGR